MGLTCTVYMVKVSYKQKPFRKEVMQTFGAQRLSPSPSDRTDVGRKILAEDPDNTGSLGCAISEAVEVAVTTEGYRYVLGSVLNQVLLHQSIIGLETKIAMEKLDEYPDIVIGCAGGGSNLGGLIAPFMQDKLTGKADSAHHRSGTGILSVSYQRQVMHMTSATRARSRPMAKMYTLGCGFMPFCKPRRRPALPRHVPDPFQAVCTTSIWKQNPYEQTKVFRSGRSVRQAGNDPSGTGICTRDPRSH